MRVPETTSEQIADAIKHLIERKRVVTIEECVTRFLAERDGTTLEALFPMSPSEQFTFWKQHCSDEVRRQFKLSASGKLWQRVHDAAPAAVRRSLQGLPAMICIDSQGLWVSSLDATDVEIEASENLRHNMAEVTEEAAKRLRRIKNALRKAGVTSLRQMANGHRDAA